MLINPVISVIIPALSPSNDLFRCLYSVNSAFLGRVAFEIICVVPDIKLFNVCDYLSVEFIKEDYPGIYEAMNKGISLASGRYLYFIGQDDVLLPSAADAIVNGVNKGADLILSDVFWGKGRIFKNSLSRHSLVWKNWCHQGVIYDRQKFINVIAQYPTEYVVQADHYVNIVFSGIPGLKIFKYHACISWYSNDGFSSRNTDYNFREAFPLIIYRYFGFISFFIVLIRRSLLNIFRWVLK